MTILKAHTITGASLACALSLVACGDDDGKTPSSDLDGSLKDSSVDASKPDASIDAGGTNKLGCPSNLVCVAPQGVYVCEEAGPKVITCDRQSECPTGTMCFPLSGQGICLALCTPDEGFPATTSMTGKVVDYNAGSGQIGFGETTSDMAVAGVKVCIESPAPLKSSVPCATTDANGQFTFNGLPPNRNPAQPVGGLLSMVKDGYLPVVMQYSLGNGSQQLGAKVRLISEATATQIAAAAGASKPSATTGWIMSAAARFDLQGTKGEYSYSNAGQDLLAMSGVTITSAPAGKGAVYLDAMEKVPAGGSDAGIANGTSISGAAFFFDVAATAPATPYTLTFTHPTLNCGAANMINVVPGFVFYGADAVCGNGVAQ